MGSKRSGSRAKTSDDKGFSDSIPAVLLEDGACVVRYKSDSAKAEGVEGDVGSASEDEESEEAAKSGSGLRGGRQAKTYDWAARRLGRMTMWLEQRQGVVFEPGGKPPRT